MRDTSSARYGNARYMHPSRGALSLNGSLPAIERPYALGCGGSDLDGSQPLATPPDATVGANARASDSAGSRRWPASPAREDPEARPSARERGARVSRYSTGRSRRRAVAEPATRALAEARLKGDIARHSTARRRALVHAPDRPRRSARELAYRRTRSPAGDPRQESSPTPSAMRARVRAADLDARFAAVLPFVRRSCRRSCRIKSWPAVRGFFAPCSAWSRSRGCRTGAAG